MTGQTYLLASAAAPAHTAGRRLAAILLSSALLLASLSALAGSSAAQARTPVLAYYYIWFSNDSWSRAKRDLPALGAYSSDDASVMRQHIRWAKAAGINGFLVSWKDTPALSRRLQTLINVADEEQFQLSIIYEGLDFTRKPLPVDQIAADFDVFVNHFAADPAFSMFAKPLIVWSGTWEFTPEDVARVTSSRRGQLLILGSERSAEAYQRLASLVDGDAYYWSSLDPDVDRSFRQKLSGMGQAIHDHGGLWIAPAAPGFDARLLGGTRHVERKDGETLRRELDAAAASSPDVIGLISWNEFSENSYVEPSRNLGTRYLDVLTQLLGDAPSVGPAPAMPALTIDTSIVPTIDTSIAPAIDTSPAPHIDTPPVDSPPPANDNGSAPP
jgi:Glycosyl hydrolase family 99